MTGHSSALRSGARDKTQAGPKPAGPSMRRRQAMRRRLEGHKWTDLPGARSPMSSQARTCQRTPGKPVRQEQEQGPKGAAIWRVGLVLVPSHSGVVPCVGSRCRTKKSSCTVNSSWHLRVTGVLASLPIGPVCLCTCVPSRPLAQASTPSTIRRCLFRDKT